MNGSETESTEIPYFNTKEFDSPNTQFSGQNGTTLSPNNAYSNVKVKTENKFMPQDDNDPLFDEKFNSLLTYNSNLNTIDKNNLSSINGLMPSNNHMGDSDKDSRSTNIDFNKMNDNIGSDFNFDPVELTTSISNFGNMNNSNNSEIMSMNLSNNNSNSYSINNIDNMFPANDTQSNDESYQSPKLLADSLNRLDVPTKADTFSPESFGFSTSYNNNFLTKTLSNTLGRSYGSHLGTSLNNLISPSSTYDGYLDSPYGSFNDDSLKSPMNSPSFKGMTSPSSSHVNSKSALSKESKLSRRRELHNAVERRRRDLIKEKIKELGTLIPPTLLYDNVKCKNPNKEIKANKNIILIKTVDYIQFLQKILEAQEKKLAELEDEIEKLDLNEPNSQIFNGENTQTEEQNLMQDVKNFMSGTEIPNDDQSQINYNDGSANATANNDYNSYTTYDSNRTNEQDAKFEKIQDSLSAFTENINLKSNNSKLNFMDLSNSKSEPLDFRKLSESFGTNNNPLNTDNMDAFLTFDNQRDENAGVPGNFGYNEGDSDIYNGNINAKETDPLNNEFHNFQAPALKFANDTDFLDQLLFKEPNSNGFGI